VGKPLPHHLRFLGAAEGAEVEQRQALGGCGRQRARKQSLSRGCSTRWTSRWRRALLALLDRAPPPIVSVLPSPILAGLPAPKAI